LGNYKNILKGEKIMNKKSEAIKKQFVAVLFSCLFILGLTSNPALGQQPKLKVGIIHIGSITDGGYNQAHAEGVAIMKKNLPEVEVIEVENVPESADAERVMENMIKQGAKLIIAASFGYLDPALRVAKKYPEVKFVHPAGYKRAPNLTTYWASTPEAFYLMGIAAGKTSKTSKMGFVCALPVSYFLANINALHLGARSVNPKMETRVVFTGTFLDPGKEATAANALLDQGADVLGMIVDSPITVVQIAEKRGAYSIGYHYLGVQKFAPKGWISGIAFTWGGLYTRFAKQVMEGTWKSENILGNLASDLIAIAPFGPAVPAEAIKLVEETKKAFIEGKKNVFEGPIKDNRGQERVKAGGHWSLNDLGKMDWLVEGIIGQPR
jgi:basic membrane lipoprotein Med (substrate-binding protein (PBP1-ABC) superfamily)